MLEAVTKINRGATTQFATIFYDVNGAIVQPVAAYVSIEYPNADGSRAETTVAMVPSSGSLPWTALWDTRGIGVGPVNWSIHSMGPPPCAVEDGMFYLTANPANLPTFA